MALIGNELKFGRGKMRDMEEKYLNEKPLIKNENPTIVMIVPFDQDEKKKPRDGSGKTHDANLWGSDLLDWGY